MSWVLQWVYNDIDQPNGSHAFIIKADMEYLYYYYYNENNVAQILYNYINYKGTT